MRWHIFKRSGPGEPVIPTPAPANTPPWSWPGKQSPGFDSHSQESSSKWAESQGVSFRDPFALGLPSALEAGRCRSSPGLASSLHLGGSLPSSGFLVAGEGAVPVATKGLPGKGHRGVGGLREVWYPWCGGGCPSLSGGVWCVLPAPLSAGRWPQERGRHWPGDPLFSRPSPLSWRRQNGGKKNEGAGIVLVKAAPR